MKRAQLESLKAEMATRYAEQLEREQTHLTGDQRAHMCIGFEHGLGWFLKIMQTAGFTVEEEGADPRRQVCMRCRQVFDGGAGAVKCPHCGNEQWAP